MSTQLELLVRLFPVPECQGLHGEALLFDGLYLERVSAMAGLGGTTTDVGVEVFFGAAVGVRLFEDMKGGWMDG